MLSPLLSRPRRTCSEKLVSRPPARRHTDLWCEQPQRPFHELLVRVSITTKRVGSARLLVNELLELRPKSAAENDVIGRAVVLIAPIACAISAPIVHALKRYLELFKLRHALHFIDESRAFRRRLPCVTLCQSAYLKPLHVTAARRASLRSKCGGNCTLGTPAADGSAEC